MTKINAEVYNFIHREMQRGKIVCRNTVESFVNKQDWTLNGKIFEFTFEWFERFSELYNIYPVKGAPIRNGFSYDEVVRSAYRTKIKWISASVPDKNHYF